MHTGAEDNKREWLYAAVSQDNRARATPDLYEGFWATDKAYGNEMKCGMKMWYTVFGKAKYI